MNNNELAVTNYFPWKKFSFYESFEYKIRTIILRILCKFLDAHSWSIEIKNWQLSDINNFEDYKKYNANTLVCDFCNKRESYSEVVDSLTFNEVEIYNRQTFYFFQKK